MARSIRALADRAAENANQSQRAAMEVAYLTSLRLEYKFWDMAYYLEGWDI